MSTKTDAPSGEETDSDVDTNLPHVDARFVPRAAPPRTRQMSVQSAAGLSDLLSQSRRQSKLESGDADNCNLDHLGGPGKCGHLYLKYWSDKKLDPRTHIPDVDVKYKVYRISDFDQKRGSFYIDFVLMLDWLDPSLELADARGANFKEHFWPKAELMNMTPDSEALDFDNPSFYPKHKQVSSPRCDNTSMLFCSRFFFFSCPKHTQTQTAPGRQRRPRSFRYSSSDHHDENSHHVVCSVGLPSISV